MCELESAVEWSTYSFGLWSLRLVKFVANIKFDSVYHACRRCVASAFDSVLAS